MSRLRHDSASAQREAARRHTHSAYRERNELLAMLARLWNGHLMAVSGHLETLDERRVVCIHSPGGALAYVITRDEAEHFSDLPLLKVSHWDHCTRLQRSARLQKIGPSTKSLPKRLSPSLQKSSGPLR